MADFDMVCEKCSQVLEVPEELIGQTAECPSCGADIVIPAKLADAPEAAEEAPPADLDQTEPEPEGDAPKKRGLGKSLLAAAGAVASEAGRGAKIAKLKAQIEKLRRVDLQRAYRELGQKAYKIRYASETYGEAYAEIETFEAQIVEKRAGVHADQDGTIANRAKATALSAKMKAEAEVLVHKRTGAFASIGKGLEGKVSDDASLNAELTALRDTQEHIDELQADLHSIRRNNY